MRKKKPVTDSPTSKTAKCFLLSEQLAIAKDSMDKANSEAIHLARKASLKSFHKAMDHAKYALGTAALISGDIGQKAKRIVRDLTNAEVNLSIGYTPAEKKLRQFDSEISKIHRDVAKLRSEAARQCGVIRYDEPFEERRSLLKEFEEKALEAVPPPPKGTVGYRAFDLKPIIKRKRR